MTTEAAAPDSSLALCAPGGGLNCFACCPPIRPPGYDPADYQGSLKRLFVETTADFAAGRRRDRPMLGFWCEGLGFLDAAGRRVGCLWHPAANRGRDLRGPGGYQAKCASYACPQALAFDRLPPETRRRLLAMCRGMDSFAYSSPRLNPLRRLLDLGPEVAAAAVALEPTPEQALAWPWLALEPHLGWLLGRWTAAAGPEVLAAGDLAARLEEAAGLVARRLGPAPPLESGVALGGLCDLWEARFWRRLTGRARAAPRQLAVWREVAAQAAGELGRARL